MPLRLLLLSFFLVAFSCGQNKNDKKNTSSKNIEKLAFKAILDASDVNGVLLIFDPQQNKYYSNNFLNAKEHALPASTFKIPNSIIGLELGILKDEQSVFEWDGTERAFAIWEKDLSLKEAFQKSCVPCYQGLARKIGARKMNESLEKLNFGNMDVKSNNIDNFWLIGDSKINTFQQIDFLHRFYNKQLPIKNKTYETLSKIIKIEQNVNYTLNGKTGLAVSPEKSIGWFVGYIEKDKKVFYFATKITPNKKEMARNVFLPIRKDVTISALKALNIID